jgi:hypothetical protein
VLQATSYSKAVLRVAAEETVRAWPNVAYFGAYEIVTQTGRAHEFFAADRRTVTPTGVGRVMDVFFEQFAGSPPSCSPVPTAVPAQTPADHEVVCDEATVLEALARRPEA